MRVFEFHFNPKNAGDIIFESFVYEPETPQEQGRGNLCLVGELSKAMPQNNDFLNNLSLMIKNEYYGAAPEGSAEVSLQSALKQANNFLDQELRRENVSWLGNLSFVVLNFQGSILNFTKVGNIKTLLIRDGEISDISQDLEVQSPEANPLKVFNNMASGRLSPEDKVLVLTKDLFSVFSQNANLLNQFSEITDEKELKKIFKINKQVFSKTSGICLLTLMGKGSENRFRLPKIKLSPLPKKIVLILTLILILTTSFLIFGKEKKEKLEGVRQKLEEAQSKIIMAESLLILKKEEKAQALFEEAREILLPLAKPGQPLMEEAASLQKSIEQYLRE